MSNRARETDLDAEQEVDLGRYARAVITRWWIPVAGLVVGAAIGYLISLGGSQVWKARAPVCLGQPYSYPGNTALQSQQTNPSSVNTIVHSEEAIDAAAAAARMSPSQLRGSISTQSISGSATSVGGTRIQQNPLVKITVQASTSRKAQIAANALAREVTVKLSSYTAAKTKLLEDRIAADQQQIDGIRRASQGNPALAVLLGTVLQDQLSAKLQLVQTQQIEQPSALTRAAAVKTTARSRRNDVVVAAFLGLVLGLIVALAWDPIAARRRT